MRRIGTALLAGMMALSGCGDSSNLSDRQRESLEDMQTAAQAKGMDITSKEVLGKDSVSVFPEGIPDDIYEPAARTIRAKSCERISLDRRERFVWQHAVMWAKDLKKIDPEASEAMQRAADDAKDVC